MTEVYGQQGTSTTDDDYNTLTFVFWMLMQKVQTNTLVKVISCTNSGGLSPVGTVTVQPLVNQMTGNREAVPHGQIFNCLYSRMTGGDNAVIMDPAEGDIGNMAFCSRDISGVVANKGPANPGSFRMFDWADGIFTANVPLGKTPTQYVRFSDTDGIVVVSPTKITLQAPTVEIDATTVNINATSAANITAPEVDIDTTTSATITSPVIDLDGEVTIDGGLSQTGGGSASLGPLVAQTVETAAGTNLDTHDHAPGTYNVSGTPVTGVSAPP